MLEKLINDTGFWVLISTVICLIVIFKFGREPVASALDERTRRVKERLDEAEELLSEARSLLASYERKNIEAMEEADTIIAEAKVKADRLRKKSEKQLAAAIDRLEKTAETRLEKARKDAELAVREHLTQQALNKTVTQLKKDKKTAAKAMDKAIDDALSSFANQQKKKG